MIESSWCPPGFEQRLEGKVACIRSYAEFIAGGKVHEYGEFDFKDDSWKDTGVVTCHYEIVYDEGGKKHHDSGEDIFVLVHGEMGGGLSSAPSLSSRLVWFEIAPLCRSGGLGQQPGSVKGLATLHFRVGEHHG